MVFNRNTRVRSADPSPVDLDRPVIDSPPDTLHEATLFAIQGLKELRTTVASQSAELMRLNAQLAQAQAEATTYRHLADENQRERDHYIRFSTELITQMQNARHLFDDCFERAKLSIFEKKAIPIPAKEIPQVEMIDDEPVPEFLTNPKRDTTR